MKTLITTCLCSLAFALVLLAQAPPPAQAPPATGGTSPGAQAPTNPAAAAQQPGAPGQQPPVTNLPPGQQPPPPPGEPGAVGQPPAGQVPAVGQPGAPGAVTSPGSSSAQPVLLQPLRRVLLRLSHPLRKSPLAFWAATGWSTSFAKAVR